MNQVKLHSIIDNLIALKPILYKNLFLPNQFKTITTPGSYYALVNLQKSGILSMSEIGKKLCIPKPNVTTIIDKLISDELVIRLPDNDDRRIINIQLTEKGAILLKEIENTIENRLMEKFSTLTESDINTLSDSLIKVNDILSKIPADLPEPV